MEPAPPSGPGLEPDTVNSSSAVLERATGMLLIQPYHPLPWHSLRKGADLCLHLKTEMQNNTFALAEAYQEAQSSCASRSPAARGAFSCAVLLAEQLVRALSRM